MKINIDINYFPYKIEKLLSNLLIIPGNYSRLKRNDLEKIKKLLMEIKKKYNIIPSNAIIRSIRSAYMNQRFILTHDKLINNKKIIIKHYNNNISILDISKKLDLSPIKLLKIILKNKGYTSKDISSLLYLISSTNDIKKIKKIYHIPLNTKFIIIVKKIIEKDIFNQIDQKSIKGYADAFEKKVEYSIDNIYGLKYKTEKNLIDEQTKKYGKPIITPDFLLLDDLYINKIKINWIDAKNYYGANTILIKKNIKKQAEKYNKAFGSGAIIFNLGVSSILNEKLKLKDTLLISFNDFNDIE
tara:strand:- start:5624 stop:6523 length:900 start_codon:yes stop_codon:yes gene_type:complete